MPPLSRQSGRLLSQVNGKQHATQNDHHDLLPTPPPSNSTRSSGSQLKRDDSDIDVLADPISSDDEPKNRTFQMPARIPASSAQKGGSGFKHVQVDGPGDAKPPGGGFKYPSSMKSPAGSTGSKRSQDSEHASSDSEGGIFSSQWGSQSSFKRPKYIGNVHAPTTTTTKVRPASKPQQKYGKTAQRRQRSAEEQKAKGFKRPKSVEAQQERKDKGATFRLPPGAFRFGDKEAGFQVPKTSAGDVAFGAADTEAFDDGGSPYLSDLSSPPSSPGVEEVNALGLPAAGPYVPKSECTICGEQVELFLKQDFEDEYNKGKQLNFKWQQRFCRYHKQHTARLLWKERGYPEIDWDKLGQRIRSRKHSAHLRRVLNGETDSMYRKQLEETLKGRSKSLLQSVKDDPNKKGASVGYYGPRGEKLMYDTCPCTLLILRLRLTHRRTEHIVATFADELRNHATKDRLVAAAGVSGGVSGFVQAVLVPELAASLVSEDLGPKSERKAVDVVAESAELGELLHPEVEDKVRVFDEDDEDMDDE